MIDLAEHEVHVAAAPRGRARDEQDIVRREEHGFDLPHHVGRALRAAVEPELFAYGWINRTPRRLFGQHHFHTHRSAFRLRIAFQARIPLSFLVPSVPGDDLAVGPSSKGLGCGEDVHGLEHVGLARGIRPVEEGDARRRMEIEGVVRPKVTQSEAFEEHGNRGPLTPNCTCLILSYPVIYACDVILYAHDMIDQASVEAVDNAVWGDHFIRPLYDSYCFSCIPELVLSLFGASNGGDVQARLLGPLAGRYDTVILCLVDAFGWRFVQKYGARYPFLRRILADGYVTKLTSQFPSTTAAHVTTIHTGLPAGESGVYEWFYYEPAL